jgi:hypothetical protein
VSLDLRPLSLGELLDRAFTLYRRHFRLFVGIMAVPSVFGLTLALLGAFLQYSMRGTRGAAGGNPIPDVATMFAILAGMMVVMFAYFVVYTVALGATSMAVSELYLGRTAGIAEVYSRMRGRLGRLVVLILLFGLRVGGVAFGGTVLLAISAGLIALASPVLAAIGVMLAAIALSGLCVFMTMRYGVAVPALVLEDLTAWQALKRSVELTAGSLWRVLLLFFLTTVVSYAGLALFQGPFAVASFVAGPDTPRGFWLSLAGVASGTIGGTLTAPIMVVGLALLYYDTRIRQEGFDLDLMLADLDRKGTPADPARA